jgi:hypothetical protein
MAAYIASYFQMTPFDWGVLVISLMVAHVVSKWT